MRTEFDQKQDLNVAIKALKTQSPYLSREFQSIYAIRNISTVEKNASLIQKKCAAKIAEFLVKNSVYEVCNEDDTDISEDKLYWFINPLEGEVNFISKNPMISIRLDLANNNECMLSVILSPILHEFIICAKGLGCNIEVNNIDYGRRYVQRETLDHSSPLIIATNRNLTQNDTKQNIILQNMNNNSLAIAYAACGYCNGFYLLDVSRHLIRVAEMFSRECSGKMKTEGNNIKMLYHNSDWTMETLSDQSTKFCI